MTASGDLRLDGSFGLVLESRQAAVLMREDLPKPRADLGIHSSVVSARAAAFTRISKNPNLSKCAP